MKYFTTILVFFSTILLLQAQTFEIRTHYVAESTFDVQMRCTSEPHPTTDTYLLDLLFGLKWQSSYDIDLGTATGNYEIKKSDVEKITGAYEWQSFYANNMPFQFPEEWTLNEWKTIATIPIAKKSTTQNIGTIEICEVGFDPTTDLNINVDGTDYVPTINGAANNVVIPLTLSHFKAKRYNRTSSYLSWDSEDEVNFDRFEIERSTGFNDWEYAGTVRGSSKDRGTKSYSFIDKDVYNSLGYQAFYYRLKMIDLDGRYVYSGSRVVEFDNGDKTPNLQVFPNPASDKVYFTLVGIDKDSEINIDIYDNTGRLVMNKSLTYQVNKNILIDNAKERLKAGIYNVIISDNNKNRFFKKLVLTR